MNCCLRALKNGGSKICGGSSYSRCSFSCCLLTVKLNAVVICPSSSCCNTGAAITVVAPFGAVAFASAAEVVTDAGKKPYSPLGGIGLAERRPGIDSI